ncbi:MAG: DUF3108 domain-containing protein [Pseudomonadota bacterium]
MSSRPFRPGWLLATALLIAAPLAVPQAETALAPADPALDLVLEYKAYKGGFRFLEVEIGMDTLQPGRYDLDLEATLVGAPALLLSYKIATQAQGRRQGQELLPERFRQDINSSSKDKPQWMELNYDERLVPEVSGDPSPEKEPRAKVSAPRRAGAYDPLTAGLDVILQLAREGSCEARVPVYDGRRRFDILAEDKGEVEMRKGTINIYSGPARLCELSVRPIGGYRFDERDRKNLPQSLEVYLAPPEPGLPAMPVRMVLRSNWGAILVHLTRVAEVVKG